MNKLKTTAEVVKDMEKWRLKFDKDLLTVKVRKKKDLLSGYSEPVTEHWR